MLPSPARTSSVCRPSPLTDTVEPSTYPAPSRLELSEAPVRICSVTVSGDVVNQPVVVGGEMEMVPPADGGVTFAVAALFAFTPTFPAASTASMM